MRLSRTHKGKPHLDQDAVLRSDARSHHDGSRRGQRERAWAGHHHDGNPEQKRKQERVAADGDPLLGQPPRLACTGTDCCQVAGSTGVHLRLAVAIREAEGPEADLPRTSPARSGRRRPG